MAEAVDLILSITELAGAVIKTGKQLYEIFQDGPKELRAILLETASLRAQLEFVDLFASSSGVASQEDHIKVQIERCQAIMKEIQQLLGRFTLDQSGKGRMSAARLRDGVLQLLRKPEVDQKLKELRCCRESLNSTLVADTWGMVKHIDAGVSEIQDKIEDQERSRILDSLVTIKPWDNHREACELHDPNTSAWITQSEEWKAWVGGELRLWWIDGIPGAGKSVLASHLIEEVKSLASQQPTCPSQGIGWAYYYCYHARSHKSENEPFLLWVIRTLSQQAGYVPLELVRHGPDLSMENLWDALTQLAARFRRVLITVDALDECQNRPAFLKIMQRIPSSTDNVSLLVTSRNEVDIRRALERISTRTSLSEPLHPLLAKDISDYIRSQLELDTFETWDAELRSEVAHDLISKAKGMYVRNAAVP